MFDPNDPYANYSTKSLSPEFRLAKCREAARNGWPAPDFGPRFRPKAAPETSIDRLVRAHGDQRLGVAAPAQAASRDADAFLAAHPGSFKRVDPTVAPVPAPVAAAPRRELSAIDRLSMAHADARQFGGVRERPPEGTAWSEEVSRANRGI